MPAGLACTLGIGQFLTICGNYVRASSSPPDWGCIKILCLSVLVSILVMLMTLDSLLPVLDVQGVNFAACYTCHTREKFRRCGVEPAAHCLPVCWPSVRFQLPAKAAVQASTYAVGQRHTI